MKSFKQNLQFIFLLIPFFKLPGFSEIRTVSKIFDAWFIIASLLIVIKVIRNTYHPSKIVVVSGILQIYLFLNTVQKGGFSTALIRSTIGVLLVMVLVDIYLTNNKRIAYTNILILFFTYSVANFFLGNSFVAGTYLFGQRTNLTTISVPVVMIVILLFVSEEYIRKNKLLVAMTAITVITNVVLILKESVSTAIIAFVVSFLFYMAFNFKTFRNIRAKTYVLACVVYNFVIVIFQSFGYMKSIFAMLGESMTMTGRLLIWSNAITAFKKKPIFGYGVNMQIVSRGLHATDTAYVHNNFLQFCLDGGIIALILFVVLILVTVKDTGKLKTMQSRLVLAINIGLIIAMISEALTSRNFYYVLLLIMAQIAAEAENNQRPEWLKIQMERDFL